jgi:hypothetical protein
VEVFQPHGGVGVPGVLNDVRWRMEARREWHLPDHGLRLRRVSRTLGC